MSWLGVLRHAVDSQGLRVVATRLGYSSKSVICEALKGSYRGNLDRLAARVLEAYGQPVDGVCPVLGPLNSHACQTQRELARRLGVRGANPQTVALRKACLSCAGACSNAVRTQGENHAG